MIQVLKGVSFAIADKEKIGVCGRTGAGMCLLYRAKWILNT